MSHETPSPVRVRLAPSPTGDPHVGTAYIGLFNYAFARSQGGSFILRIEDTDRQRSTLESEKAILRALKWLGLEWDEGPDRAGAHGPYRQSERSELYRKAAEQLVESGAAYRCFCTAERLGELREQQKKAKGAFGYDRHCRAIPPEEARRRADAGEPHVMRLAVPETGETAFNDLIRGPISVQNRTIDDQVLLKSDGFPTYHLANVVDDHAMLITHVIRAEEWITSTPKHILLYAAFGWRPPIFAHMPLLRNTDKSKISKRKNPTSLDWYREQGFLPEALLNFLGLMGWSALRPRSGPTLSSSNGSASNGREIFTLQEMIADFSWDRVGRGAPVFDMTKLEWINGEYIRALDPQTLARRLRESVPLAANADEQALMRALPLARERMKKLNDFASVCDFLFTDDVSPKPADLVAKNHTAAETADALDAVRAALESAPEWKATALDETCRALAEGRGWKVGDLYMAIRVAITGRTATPPLFESIEALGRDRTLARILKAAHTVKAA